MAASELLQKLNELRGLPAETEVFEFKEAKNGYDFSKLGKYFSALSNEANLKGKPHAWLVFGIKDKGRTIVGSRFRPNRNDLDSLKGEIASKTTNRITFIEIYEMLLPEGRVLMFQIPAAPKGLPIAFDGHYYGRDGEELSPLNLEEIERIRSQAIIDDWSAAILSNATIEDLDPSAITKARENYKNKFPEKAAEVDTWDDITFLNKAKITIKGKITRAAIILLGKGESEHFINPAEAKIRWVLKDTKGNDKDYHIESCPLFLAVDKIYAKIRNLKYRYIKDGTLFPDEVDQYEPFVIREAINNCIAHQDYTKGGRINVVEMEDQLVFTNLGSFIPGSVEKVITEDAPEEHYRNRFLATAMFNLKMVDTAGGGIRKMFNYQRERFFPMPEYDLSGEKVKVTVIGKVLDMDFAKVLARNPSLSLEQIIILDKVQKRKRLTEGEANYLKGLGLIEGRKPNYIISAKIAASLSNEDLKAQYIKHRGLDDEHYKKLIIEYLTKFGKSHRKELEQFLWTKLPDILTENQKKNKVTNLLSALRISGKIKNSGYSEWSLV
ncbi:MAG: ATP-dependent DNA helicase RecG-related protein [Candidatus Jettenia ecosi]|uniref:ATP-dependent DNA helicase RecG-related protein n=1 Tax=Candidatus Jettenia ecosi TaxID=2494326 RepID=A0A533QF89_9BACT|nr:MAG: ATP-dependent DNA helicase RecG-related protein [Candidatus Jettenia ecosi]